MKMDEIRKELNVFYYLCSMLINEKTWDFIRQHADDDVRKLALRGVKDAEVDLAMALQQIAGRQTARRKLPSWAEKEGIIYPPHLNMEQCSSEQTARYKAKIVNGKSVNGKFVDLTGGFGVDFYWMSQGFRERIYVEQNAELCAIVEANFALLGLPCSVCCCDTATYLNAMPHADVVYLDPARRNGHGGRTYGIADCTPNVLELLPQLMEKADRVVLKLSPMLDWRKAVEDIQKPTANSQQPIANSQQPIASVSEVHIVSVDNECKELLLMLSREQTDGLRLVCVNNDSMFETVRALRTQRLRPTDSAFAPYGKMLSKEGVDGRHYLYEPNASIMKAGCFAEVEERFPVAQISVNSHLFLSSDEIGCFPGRGFQILAVSSMNKKEINQKLTAMERANLTVRNFPMSVDQLRKKLKLKDGGDVYIFATTMADGEHRLLICRKIG